MQVLRVEWLDEHLEGPGTGEANFPRFLISQGQLNQAGSLGRQDVFGVLDDLRVHTAANSDRAEHLPPLPHPHLRTFLTGGRALGVHQRRQGNTLVDTAELVELLEKFRHRMHTTLLH